MYPILQVACAADFLVAFRAELLIRSGFPGELITDVGCGPAPATTSSSSSAAAADASNSNGGRRRLHQNLYTCDGNTSITLLITLRVPAERPQDATYYKGLMQRTLENWMADAFKGSPFLLRFCVTGAESFSITTEVRHAGLAWHPPTHAHLV